jgi:TRAP-type C4-dicarboxylate transport system permease small subunit
MVWFNRFLTWVDGLVKGLIIALMALTMLVTFLQVVARYVAQSALTSPDQVARILVVWLTFIGAAAAFRQGKNIRIDTLERLLPEKLRAGLEVIFDLALAGLLLILIVTGYQVTIVAASQEVLGTPFHYGYVCAALVAGSVLMFLAVLARLAVRLGGSARTPGLED